MSKPSPYSISIGEGGRFVRCEWDAHYLTDEQLETARRYVETLQAKNAKLRDALGRACRWMADNYGTCPYDQFELEADEVCENDCTPERVEKCWAEYMQGIRWPENMTMEVEP